MGAGLGWAGLGLGLAAWRAGLSIKGLGTRDRRVAKRGSFLVVIDVCAARAEICEQGTKGPGEGGHL
jgi:hypothetical protein